MVSLKDLTYKSCYSVFCGAGISVNSGIPMVVTLQSYLLRKLGVSDKNIESILNSGMPFEVFMETINDLSDISPLLHIFDIGQPNHTHKHLANEIRRGRVACVMTTNFDCHLETALTDVGLIEGVDFRVIHNEFYFVNLEAESLICPLIVKLHGCYKKTAQLGVVMKAVASKRKKEEVESIIHSFFNDVSSEKIVFMGYSFSDHFDITPAIENNTKNDQNILVVEHCNEYRQDYQKSKGCFSGYVKAFTSKTNTCLEIEGCGFSLVRYFDDQKWKSIVDVWFELTVDIDELLPKNIELELLLKSIRYQEAVNTGESLISKLKNRNRWFSRAVGSLGIAYYRQRNYLQAFKMHRMSLEVAKETGERILEHRALNNMANILYSKNKELWAIGLLNKSVSIAKDLDCDNLLATAYANLSLNLSRFDRYDSIEMKINALNLYIKIGDVLNISKCKINLGIEYYFVGDYDKAIIFLSEGMDECYKNGQNSNLVYALIYLGLIYYYNGDKATALIYHQQATAVSSEFKITLIEHRLNELGKLLGK